MNSAAVDIGTNSVRLLITAPNGQQIERHMNITRLGQGVDVTGSLAQEAIARTVAVLRDYAAAIEKHRVTKARAVATSAARDASNSEEFFGAVEQALGFRPELLSGDEEAALSFRGATEGLDPAGGPFLVVDIGGGSTEFVLGTAAPEALISVDMGCVRMTERHFAHDPPTAGEIEACFLDVRRVLEQVRKAVPVARARQMIGLAGTVTALALLATGQKHYDPALTHHSTLTRAKVEELFAELARAPLEQRRALLAEPKRAEVIVGGSAVLLAILRELDIAELTVSESDILDGLAASLFCSRASTR